MDTAHSTPAGATVPAPSEPTPPLADDAFDVRHPADLRAAACRLAAGHTPPPLEELAPEELLAELHAVLGVLSASEPHGTAISEARSAVRRQLLDLLRAEVVRGWREQETPPAPEAMLELLSGFERAREALHPDRDYHFASQLMGPTGLEYLMEIAHDLRSPLTSILFLAETLRAGQSGAINDVQHRQLGIIYSAALGLTSVVSDVIELARGGNRLLEREPSPLSIAEIHDSVRDIVRPMAEEKGLTIRLLSPATDQRLGYPVALSRVLLNLTTNGLKFTDEGFVEIVARATTGARVEFSVRDTGRGIRPEVLDSLYRPFQPSRTQRGFRFSGTGLGLAICRKLVEAMGAELRLETDADWGTRFFFELDLPHIPQQ
jgi:signal transduction histidine kinase